MLRKGGLCADVQQKSSKEIVSAYIRENPASSTRDLDRGSSTTKKLLVLKKQEIEQALRKSKPIKICLVLCPENHCINKKQGLCSELKNRETQKTCRGKIVLQTYLLYILRHHS